MTAAIADQTYPAQLVAKQHQVFAEQPHEARRLFGRQLLGNGDRVPVASKELAPGRAWANPGQKFIFFLGQHDASVFFVPVRGSSMKVG